MNGLSRWVKITSGIIGIVIVILGIGAWAHSLNSGLHEIANGLQDSKTDLTINEKAIVKISEQITQHISEDRYQDCYERGISPKECPPPGNPLPNRRRDD